MIIETAFQTGGDDEESLPGMSDSPTQHYINGSVRQFADTTNDQNVNFYGLLETI